MYSSAIVPVPAPKEIFFNLEALFFVSAKLIKIFSGSVPGSINSKGKYFTLSA